MPIQPARLIKARPYQKWWKWIVPCELLAVTTVVGNTVANSLEPKKLTTKVSVAMKVSPCLNWLPRDSRDMLPKLWSGVFRDYGPGTVVAVIHESSSYAKTCFGGHGL